MNLSFPSLSMRGQTQPRTPLGFPARIAALAVIVLLSMGALWGLGGHRWTPPPPQTPDPTLFEPLWSPPPPRLAAAFEVQAQRPLFNPSRRPEKESGPVLAPPTDAFDQWTLLGVFGTNAKNGGVIVRSPDQQIHRLKVGQTFEGWALSSVEPKAAVFSSPEGSRRVVMQRLPQQGQMVAPPPRASASPSIPPPPPVSEITPDNPPKNSFLEAIQRAMEAAQQQSGQPPPGQ
jgi:hypothetical protein